MKKIYQWLMMEEKQPRMTIILLMVIILIYQLLLIKSSIDLSNEMSSHLEFLLEIERMLNQPK